MKKNKKEPFFLREIRTHIYRALSLSPGCNILDLDLRPSAGHEGRAQTGIAARKELRKDLRNVPFCVRRPGEETTRQSDRRFFQSIMSNNPVLHFSEATPKAIIVKQPRRTSAGHLGD